MNTQIFNDLRAAKVALNKAQEAYDIIEAEALQVAASIDKNYLKELKVEYRAGRELWQFDQCQNWLDIRAELEPINERLKEVEAKEKALAKVFYQNSLNSIIDGDTGEVIEPMAKLKGCAKGAIILK